MTVDIEFPIKIHIHLIAGDVGKEELEIVKEKILEDGEYYGSMLECFGDALDLKHYRCRFMFYDLKYIGPFTFEVFHMEENDEVRLQT